MFPKRTLRCEIVIPLVLVAGLVGCQITDHYAGTEGKPDTRDSSRKLAALHLAGAPKDERKTVGTGRSGEKTASDHKGFRSTQLTEDVVLPAQTTHKWHTGKMFTDFTVHDAILGFGHTKTVQSIEPMAPIPDPLMIDSQLEPQQLINVGDQVEIRFPYRKEYNQTLFVREDGMIAPLLIEPVMAVGRTPDALRAELTRLYGLRAYNPIQAGSQTDVKEYYIQSGDVLDIRLDFHPEYNERAIVRPDGKITLNRVKTVVAEGKTPEALERELTERFKHFVKEPSLVVIVREFASEIVFVNGQPVRPGLKNLDDLSVALTRPVPQQIYVTGEVGTPGFYPYRAPVTLARAIITAGGYKRTSKLQSVIILRKNGVDAPIAMKVNLRPELKGEETTDVPLRPYDIVVVPKTDIAKLQDFLDQYLWNLIPATRNSAFLFFTNLNPVTQPLINPVTQIPH